MLCCVEGRAIGALGDPIESSATVVADIAVGVAHAANPIFGDPHTCPPSVMFWVFSELSWARKDLDHAVDHGVSILSVHGLVV